MKKKFFSAALAAAMVVTSVFSTTSVAERQKMKLQFRMVK